MTLNYSHPYIELQALLGSVGHLAFPPSWQVLFDDIGQSLIKLCSPDLQFRLIEAFLQFLGVPSGFVPPASCLYLAMDENSIFDHGLHDAKPLTCLSSPFSGVSCVGHMDPLGGRRWTRGHSRDGEDFIRNIFHLVLPLFSGKEKSDLCSSWLQYETAKVTQQLPLRRLWVSESFPRLPVCCRPLAGRCGRSSSSVTLG